MIVPTTPWIKNIETMCFVKMMERPNWKVEIYPPLLSAHRTKPVSQPLHCVAPGINSGHHVASRITCTYLPCILCLVGSKKDQDEQMSMMSMMQQQQQQQWQVPNDSEINFAVERSYLGRFLLNLRGWALAETSCVFLAGHENLHQRDPQTNMIITQIDTFGTAICPLNGSILHRACITA
jgi:hypothetical protein